VLGGPGVPYFYGSGRDRNGETPEASLRALRGAFDRLFPSLSDARFEHTWSGVLGIPRDWSATVSADATTGICLAGGYVGDGLSGSNLAARTLRDLVLGLPTDLARLPWVNKRIRRWEPEPARFIALRGLYGVYNLADRRERSQDSASTSVLARVANRISGRY
ncbi:MAG: FAD-dependent oxidoreductase, partial [Herbiconiux sp.]|nr:FAD-dependent oxidoreductase [Herbiconiux sp.]